MVTWKGGRAPRVGANTQVYSALKFTSVRAVLLGGTGKYEYRVRIFVWTWMTCVNCKNCLKLLRVYQNFVMILKNWKYCKKTGRNWEYC